MHGKRKSSVLLRHSKNLRLAGSFSWAGLTLKEERCYNLAQK